MVENTHSMNNVEVKVCSWQGHIWSKHQTVLAVHGNNLMQKNNKKLIKIICFKSSLNIIFYTNPAGKLCK